MKCPCPSPLKEPKQIQRKQNYSGVLSGILVLGREGLRKAA